MKYNQIFATIFLVLVLGSGCTQTQKNSEPVHSSQNHSAFERKDNGYSEKVNSGKIKIDTMKGSPLRQSMAIIEGAHLHLTYRSPGVKGRVIWGGLVPYGDVWAAGAHHPTHIISNAALVFGNTPIPKGDYALFFIPGKKEWTVILNSDFEQHMSDNYDPKLDLVRFKVVPQENSRFVSRLTYQVLPGSGNKGYIVFEWEKLQVSVPFEVPNANF